MTYAPKFRLGSAADPLANYGRRGAAYLLQTVATLPPKERDRALDDALARVDPTLPSSVRANMARLKGRGVSGRAAVQRAIAGALSDGLVDNLVRRSALQRPLQQLGGTTVISSTGTANTTARWEVQIGPLTFSGAGALPANLAAHVVEYESDGGGRVVRRHTGAARAFSGTMTPVPGAVFRVTGTAPPAVRDAVAQAVNAKWSILSTWGDRNARQLYAYKAFLAGTYAIARTTINGTLYGIRFTGPYSGSGVFSLGIYRMPEKKGFLSFLTGLTLWVVRIVAKGVEKAAEYAEKAADKLADMACSAINSSFADYAAAGAAAYSGQPPGAGAAGVQAARGVCAGDQGGGGGVPPMAMGSSWVLPVAIGGVLLYALMGR